MLERLEVVLNFIIIIIIFYSVVYIPRVKTEVKNKSDGVTT